MMIDWTNLKRRNADGDKSGDRIEIGAMRFVLAAYDSGTDLWVIAPANQWASESGNWLLTNDVVRSPHVHKPDGWGSYYPEVAEPAADVNIEAKFFGGVADGERKMIRYGYPPDRLVVPHPLPRIGAEIELNDDTQIITSDTYARTAVLFRHSARGVEIAGAEYRKVGLR